jgi:transcriptional regulator with XRE-family HTH domain
MERMEKAALVEYAGWRLTEIPLPKRSTLYAPAPMGTGTAVAESLTSYLARLAKAHCVYPGVLLSQMIVPHLPEAETQSNADGSHPLFRRDGSGSHLINVTGPRACSALHALETLTLRTDLRALTLLALAELLPPRRLTRRTLAWCPLCYEQWQEHELILYDPLLWVFQEISICTQHHVRLRTHCPHCAKSLPHLAWRSRPGYCAFCAGPLFGKGVGVLEAVVPMSSEFLWQQWVTDALGAVISRLPEVRGGPKRERIQGLVNHAVEQLADGNIATFARLLGLPRNTVENWCRGKRILEMDMLLRLCYRLDLSLCDVLLEEEEMPHPHLRDPMPPALFPSRKRTPIDNEHLFHQLEQAAKSREDPPPSLKEVGQRLGYQPTTLYKINRAACHTIAERYTAYRRQLREKRLQGYASEIREIALQLQAEQVELTQKHIARYLTQPAILRDPKVRDLLRDVCREVEDNLTNTLKEMEGGMTV